MPASGTPKNLYNLAYKYTHLQRNFADRMFLCMCTIIAYHVIYLCLTEYPMYVHNVIGGFDDAIDVHDQKCDYNVIVAYFSPPEIHHSLVGFKDTKYKNNTTPV